MCQTTKGYLFFFGLERTTEMVYAYPNASWHDAVTLDAPTVPAVTLQLLQHRFQALALCYHFDPQASALAELEPDIIPMDENEF